MSNGNSALKRTKRMTLIVAALGFAFVAYYSPSDGATLGSGQSTWKAPTEAKAKENPLKGNKQAMEKGKKLFASNCAMCHGNTGKGDGPLAASLDPKPANLSDVAKNESDGELFWKISNGKLPMPSFQKTIKEKDRWAVVAYIKSL